MWVSFKRICEYDAPLNVIAESASDWTHFTHLHRRSHLEFRLLSKSGKRETFLYKARIIYPLPFYWNYLVFREYLPDQCGYHQCYLNIRTGKVHYLNHRAVTVSGRSRIEGTFRFEIAGFWRLIPGVFRFLFTRRMHRVMLEDDSWVADRLKNGVFENPSCSPKTPEQFDLMTELLDVTRSHPDLILEDLQRRNLTEL
jgi:hypothetical protein